MLDKYLNYLQEDETSQEVEVKGVRAAQQSIEKAMRSRIRNIPPRYYFGAGRKIDLSGELSRSLRAIKRAQKVIMVARRLRTATAIASFLLASSALIYHRYLTKAAKECKEQVIVNDCIKKYRLKARKEQLSHLRSKRSKCGVAKNPEVCEKRIDKKIKSLQRLIRKTS